MAVKSQILSLQIFKNVSKDINEILRTALKKAVEFTDTDGGLISLLSRVKDGMKDITYLYSKKDPNLFVRINHAQTDDNQKAVSGFVRYMMKMENPIILEGYPDHPAVKGLPIAGVKSLAAVPIKGGDAVIGTIGVFDYFHGKRFDNEDLNILQFTADHTMVFVENALLFQKVENAKKEWKVTFDAMVDQVMLVDKEHRIIRCNMALAKAFNTHPSKIIQRKCYEIVHGTDSPWPTCPHKESIKTGMPVSKEIDDPHMGGVYYISTSPLFNTQGNIYATVHVARDITRMKDAEKKIEIESRINKGLLKAAEVMVKTLERDDMLKRVARIAPQVVDADICFILIWDNSKNAFLPNQVWGISKDLLPEFMTLRFTSDIPMIEKIIKKETVVIEDAINTLLLPEGMAKIFGAGNLINIPIITRRRIFGVIGIGRTGISRPFQKDDELLVSGIANYLATALENAALHKESVDKTIELSRRIETISVMHEIDKHILSSMDSQNILDTVVYMISKIIPADKVMVFLVDNERKGFVYISGFGVKLISGTFVPFDKTTAAEVVRTGRLEYYSDLASIADLPALERHFIEKGFHSNIRIPLMIKGETIGVLSIGSKRPSAFTPEHLSILEKLACQISIALENARHVSDLKELFMGTITTLSDAIDAKSPWTAGHSKRVTEIAAQIGAAMRLDQKTLKDLEIAGLLHDIGKLATYEAILDKPGKLTEDEMAIIKKHPVKGAEILSPIKQLKDIIPAIKYHHEFYNGAGYPDGLKGEEIPLMARILAVADTVDAMGADRPYRKGRAMDDIKEELKRCSGTHFDADVVKAFLKTVKFF